MGGYRYVDGDRSDGYRRAGVDWENQLDNGTAGVYSRGRGRGRARVRYMAGVVTMNYKFGLAFQRGGFIIWVSIRRIPRMTTKWRYIMIKCIMDTANDCIVFTDDSTGESFTLDLDNYDREYVNAAALAGLKYHLMKYDTIAKIREMSDHFDSVDSVE